MLEICNRVTALLAALLISVTIPLTTNVHAGEEFDVPQVDLGIRKDGQYVRVNEYTVPDEHTIGDGIIAYEGPGIESSKVAYRLYLDERSVLDVFGKKTAEAVLQNVGRGDDYHSMADWGMDILKVGESLGAGGLGVYEDGRMRMVGPAHSLSVQVAVSSPDTAAFVVMHKGLDSAVGVFDLSTRYSMTRDSRLLTVLAKSDEQSPALAAGLVKHPGTKHLQSPESDKYGWAYIATYGPQSLADDDLGLALFYQRRKDTEVKDDGNTIGVVFSESKIIHYKVAAVWAAEPEGISDINAFEAYLNDTLERLSSD